jgi:phosphoribosylanthranilate isomerase
LNAHGSQSSSLPSAFIPSRCARIGRHRQDSRLARKPALEIADRPVILAGGLTTENVRRAILEVRPTGVDCHTGVEDSSGRKSREKVRKSLSEAYEAFETVKAK